MSENHSFALNKCIISITDKKIKITNILNAMRDREFYLDGIRKIKHLKDSDNINILALDDYHIKLEPSAVHIIPEIIDAIKEKRKEIKESNRVLALFERGLLSEKEYHRLTIM